MGQYFVGIGLPEKEEKIVARLKEEFGSRRGRTTPAHLTLIPPFFDQDETRLVKKLEQWAKK